MRVDRMAVPAARRAGSVSSRRITKRARDSDEFKKELYAVSYGVMVFLIYAGLALLLRWIVGR